MLARQRTPGHAQRRPARRMQALPRVLRFLRRMATAARTGATAMSAREGCGARSLFCSWPACVWHHGCVADRDKGRDETHWAPSEL